MAKSIRCGSCGREFFISAQRTAGTVPCPECHKSVDLLGKPVASTLESGGMKAALVIFGLIGAAAVVVLFKNRGGGEVVVQPPVPVAPASAQPRAESPEEASQRKKVEAAAAARQVDQLVRRFGADKVATVIVQAPKSDAKVVDPYLSNHLFRAAYGVYRSGIAAATSDGTAVTTPVPAAEEPQTPFAPDALSFDERYRRARSTHPYPEVISGGELAGTYTYFVVPVISLQEFAVRAGLDDSPTLSEVGRTITLRATLPQPVPNPVADDLALIHGDSSVARVVVSNAPGPAPRVIHFLTTQTAKLDPDHALTVAGVKSLGSDRYELFVAPVSDLEQFAARLEFGKSSKIMPEDRTIMLVAELPPYLPPPPTAEELETQRLAREEEERRNRPTRFDQAPKPREDFFVWVVRVIRGGDAAAWGAALQALAEREVDAARLAEVSKVLSETLPNARANMPLHVDAILKWRTPEGDRALLDFARSGVGVRDQEAVLRGVSQLGSEEASAVIIAALADPMVRVDCVPFAVALGSLVEEPVLKLIKHADDKVRTRAYLVLKEVGTKRSQTSLSGNLVAEKDQDMKALVREAQGAIRRRAAEEAAAEKKAAAEEDAATPGAGEKSSPAPAGSK